MTKKAKKSTISKTPQSKRLTVTPETMGEMVRTRSMGTDVSQHDPSSEPSTSPMDVPNANKKNVPISNLLPETMLSPEISPKSTRTVLPQSTEVITSNAIQTDVQQSTSVPGRTLSIYEEKMFKGPYKLYNDVEKELRSINGSFWNDENVKKGDVSKDITSVLDVIYLLENGVNMKKGEGIDSRFIKSPRTLVQTMTTFCNDFLCIYSTMFLNRKPSDAEKEDIVKDFKKIGLPGCMGNVSKMNVVIENNFTKKDRSFQVEIWLDSTNYCWHADDVKTILDGEDGTEHLKTTFRSVLWRNQLMLGSKPYRIVTEGADFNSYYFLVEEDMPKWNVFVRNVVEGRSKAGRKLKKIFTTENERRSTYVQDMKDKFAILSDFPSDFNMDLILNVVKVCIIFMNMMNRREMNMKKNLTVEETSEKKETIVVPVLQENDVNENVRPIQHVDGKNDVSQIDCEGVGPSDIWKEVAEEETLLSFKIANDEGEESKKIVTALKKRCDHV